VMSVSFAGVGVGVSSERTVEITPTATALHAASVAIKELLVVIGSPPLQGS
jgi:hypothetical protein